MSDSYLSITDLNSILNLTLEESVGQVAFTGEIHQLTRPQSGHLYFDLKDESSRAAAVMWRGAAEKLGFNPQPGMEVVCYGRPNVYGRSGKLQMIVFKMEPAGEGLLQKKFLALKASLEKEGLFSKERKRSLPFLPTAIGIVTSGSGAAIHDIVVKLNERMPTVRKYLIDVRVQGDGAAVEIAKAIEQFNDLGLVDVLIVGRGGGSLEDLWAFNEEIVVRAVFASRIPVISGVGHEVDVSLSDLAADARAPTPTAAAEMAVPHRDDLLRQLMEYYRRLSDTDRWLQPLTQALDDLILRFDHALSNSLQEAKGAVRDIEMKVRTIEPAHRLALLSRQLQESQHRLQKSLSSIVHKREQSLSKLAGRLTGASQRATLDRLKERVSRSEVRLQSAIAVQLDSDKQTLMSLGKLLDSLSPYRVLDRGFAIVHHGTAVVRSSKEIAVNDSVQITVADGGFAATVNSISKRKKGEDK